MENISSTWNSSQGPEEMTFTVTQTVCKPSSSEFWSKYEKGLHQKWIHFLPQTTKPWMFILHAGHLHTQRLSSIFAAWNQLNFTLFFIVYNYLPNITPLDIYWMSVSEF